LGGDEAIYNEVKRLSIAIYNHAREHAASRGIILADTKFEFGRDPQSGAIVLGDEVLTPDSSRYWPADAYEPGRVQASFDKQFVRDWARSTGWDKTPPAPEIPPHIVAQTQERYIEAYEKLAGRSFTEWLDGVGALA
jgi:phosphoribosylaminoimidazole-succinocarboxamide synthase